MKLKITLLFLIISSFGFAQKRIGTVQLSNGKTITIYDNKTWEYVSTNSQIQGFKSTPTQRYTTSKRTYNRSNSSSNSYSSYCGARNKTGGYCRRKVSGGGRCWQHR